MTNSNTDDHNRNTTNIYEDYLYLYVYISQSSLNCMEHLTTSHHKEL